jgi:hypothetical protein
MALVKLGSNISAISGSLGGSHFSMKPAGCVLSINRHSVKKSYSFADRYRAKRRVIVQGWKNLSEANRLTWLTTSYHGLSGYQLFLKVNMISALNTNVVDFQKCPSFANPKYTPVVTFTWNSGAKTLTVAVNPAPPSGYTLWYYMTLPVLPTRTIKGCRWFKAGSLTSGAPSSSASTRFNAVNSFGLQIGYRYYFKFVLINSSTGSFSAPIYSSFLTS